MKEVLHDIAVIGAGPTGLALGAELLRLGRAPLIFDKLAAGQNTTRAVVVHARTLEVLKPLCVTKELIQNGVIVTIFRIRDRGRILATVDFKDLKTEFPYTLMCSQERTEAILLRRFEGLGGAILRPREVGEVHPGDSDVQVRLTDGQAFRAKWVVGCDGGHSVVRESAGIEFEGAPYPETFLLGDVVMDWPIDRNEVDLFYSERGLLVVAPLPDGHFRMVATVAQAPEFPTIDDFQTILAERGPDHGSVKIHRLAWASRFHLQHRLAKTFRQGRILIAGDAAHVHSPAGGQGMNTGIQDAISLADALHHTLDGDTTALDHWQDARLKVARSVVELTHRMTKVATATSPLVKTLRNAAVEIIGHIPFATHAIAQTLSELDNR